MADAISIQELIDARTDAKTLEEAVNGDAVTTVLSRLGETYPTLSNALNQIDSKLDSADAQIKQGITNLFENGGLPATPFATKVLMTASALVDGDYAVVTDDTVNNGLYIKTAGAWVRSEYDPLRKSKELVDDLEALEARYDFALDNKLDRVVIGEQSKLFVFSDTMGNEALSIDDKGVVEATDFKGENLALSDLEQLSKIDVKYDKNPKNSIFNVSDSMGKAIIDVAEDGHLYIPNIPNGMSVQQALLEGGDSESGGSTTHTFKLMQRYSIEQDVITKQSIDKLIDVAYKQRTPFRQDVRASEYGDGTDHHIQRIPCIFRHKDNEALLFFNRGLNGYDGDSLGAELFKSVVKWDSNYKITEVTTPELFYSLQSVEAGSSVKHPAIGRLQSGNLIMLIDRRIMSSPSTRYTQEYSLSTDNGDTWSEWQGIVLNNTFIQPEEDITLVSGTGTKILTLDSGRLVTSIYTSTEIIRRMAYMYSDDDGQTWNISNPVGGSESIGTGFYFGESPIIQNSKGELISYARSEGISRKRMVISRDNGETLEYLDAINDFGVPVCQSASATLLDSIVVLSTPSSPLSGIRTNFSLKLSLNDGYNFDFIDYKPYPIDAYKGYASIEILDNEYILLAVEGADVAGRPNKSESIDLLMVNLSEVIENGIILQKR